MRHAGAVRKVAAWATCYALSVAVLAGGVLAAELAYGVIRFVIPGGVQ